LKLSLGVRTALTIAAAEALVSKHEYIRKEHLLIGICSLDKIDDLITNHDIDSQSLTAVKEEYRVIEDCLRNAGGSSVFVRRTVRKKMGVGSSDHPDRIIHRDAECRTLFQESAQIPDLKKTNGPITCLYLLYKIIHVPGLIIEQTFRENKVDLDNLKSVVKTSLIDSHSIPQEIELSSRNNSSDFTEKTPYLISFARDLTKEAKDGSFTPLIGRREELKQILQILLRKNKNNPVLVGEPGVGKTAIIEALAQRIADGKTDRFFKNKRILAISGGHLIAGTKYRGELHKRLTGIIDEVNNNPDVILFIDEVHTLLGTSSGEGVVDATNILKPALSQGRFRCIGCTTPHEYSKYIESDPALERRFEKVTVSEPDKETAIKVLAGLKEIFEKHHGVKISDSAITASVILSIRFDPIHFLPDKAIDLLDRACTEIRLPELSLNFEKDLNKDQKIKDELIIDQLSIARVLSRKMTIPLEVITSEIGCGTETRLAGLSDFLQTKIIGQDHAIRALSNRLLMSHTGLGNRRGPLGVFLFLGPTGVGKTTLALSLAEYLFGSDDDIIRLDMSEFMDKSSHTKLIGSPPGYIRSDEEGILTGFLKKKPYCVVLLDEIEKAHPDIMDIFLQVFDEGRISDNKGQVIDVKNVIFIITSNIRESTPSGPDSDKEFGVFYKSSKTGDEEIHKVLRTYFKPEFLNRIEEIVMFNTLTKPDIKNILIPILEGVTLKIKDSFDISIMIDEKVIEYITNKGYDPSYGARKLRRVVEDLIEKPLSQMIVKKELHNHKSWNVVIVNDDISFSPGRE
jgi:ATP-dependent Clp protease ATP-binding subunit ClpC